MDGFTDCLVLIDPWMGSWLDNPWIVGFYVIQGFMGVWIIDFRTDILESNPWIENRVIMDGLDGCKSSTKQKVTSKILVK